MDMFKTKNLKKLNIDLRRIGKELLEEGQTGVATRIGQVLLVSANNTRNDILKSIRNTPRLKRKWINWPNEAREKRRHHPSKPGSPPAIDTGNMLKSIVFDAYDYKFIIGSIQTAPPYPEWLEKPPPKAKYKARPWLDPAVDKQEPIIVEQLGNIVPDITDKIFRKRA